MLLVAYICKGEKVIPWNLLKVQNPVRLNVQVKWNLPRAYKEVMCTYMFPHSRIIVTNHYRRQYYIWGVFSLHTISGEYSHHTSVIWL